MTCKAEVSGTYFAPEFWSDPPKELRNLRSAPDDGFSVSFREHSGLEAVRADVRDPETGVVTGGHDPALPDRTRVNSADSFALWRLMFRPESHARSTGFSAMPHADTATLTPLVMEVRNAPSAKDAGLDCPRLAIHMHTPVVSRALASLEKAGCTVYAARMLGALKVPSAVVSVVPAQITAAARRNDDTVHLSNMVGKTVTWSVAVAACHTSHPLLRTDA